MTRWDGLGKTFLVGVNYWPRRKAMYWWKGFQRSEVEEEFQQIRDLNLSLVRIFLLWEDFQPAPQEMDPHSLGNLKEVLEIAAQLGLRVMPTLFTGHMSGANWIPSWALGGERTSDSRFPVISAGEIVKVGIRDIFEDELMLEAELFQIRSVVSALKGHGALFAWDLANEMDNLLVPRSAEVGRRWANLLSEEIRKIDPAHPITCGLHSEVLEEDKHLRPQDMAQASDFLSMHGYALYARWGNGPLDPHVAPFLSALTQSLGGLPVMFQEFGLSTTRPGERGMELDVKVGEHLWRRYLASEEEGASYYSAVLKGLYEVGSLGALAWCYSDYDDSLWGRPPLDRAVHERAFGITRNDGSVKPMGRVISQFADQRRKVKTGSSLPLGFSANEYYRSPNENLVSLFRHWTREGWI